MIDKLLHLSVGINIAIIVGIIAFKLGAEYPQGYGVLAGAVAGLGKEVWDRYRGKTGFNFFDMFATFVGAFFGGAVVTFL